MSDDTHLLDGKIRILDDTPVEEPEWTIAITGRRYEPFNPRVESVSLKDIAAHLSKQCRYHGAIDCFFSVAQHLVLCKRMAEMLYGTWLGAEGLLHVLLHDAGEAYMGDMIRPMKIRLRRAGVSIFDDAEHQWMECIHRHFGLNPPTPEVENAIEEIDEFARLWELSRLKPPYAGWDAVYGRVIYPGDFPKSLWDSMLDDNGDYWSPDRGYREFMIEAQNLLGFRPTHKTDYANKTANGFPEGL